MKYIVILGDGMADVAVPALGGLTPLEAAHKPHMDALARQGLCGMARTIPPGMPTGSEVANLAAMGYDPAADYRGRSPLEAVSMGIPLGPHDVAVRCNLVTMSEEADLRDAVLIDYCADEVSTQEARELIGLVAARLERPGVELHPGISYRHCLVLRDARTGTQCTPPHDIMGQRVGPYLPQGLYADMLESMTEASRGLLARHPINLARQARGQGVANACWFWGEGTATTLEPFARRYGIGGGVISAVDLIKGIGLCAGLEAPEIPGATGTLHTDFAGKGRAALDGLLGGWDFVYIHVEAPDECGHAGAAEGKVTAIERIDRDILGPLLAGLEAAGEDCRVLLMPDHPTPLHLRTHTADPVPFVLWDSRRESPGLYGARYTEADCRATGVMAEQGFTLMERLVRGDF